MADVATVIWKDFKELFRVRGSVRAALPGLLGPIAMMLMLGIVLPWQVGQDWLEGPFSIFAAGFVSLMFGGITAESIAGEKERHTLETLLASRLPDKAIFFGKLGLAVSFASVGALVIAFLGLVSVNTLHWSGSLQLYSPIIGMTVLVCSPLMAIFAAGVGVFISLRARTAQEAQQNVMMILAAGPMALIFGTFIVVTLVPGLENRVENALENPDPVLAVAIIAAILVVVDLVLIVAAARRFQRAKLILD